MSSVTAPDWVESCLIDDAVFARAYAQVSDRQRAWLKTCIARLMTWLGDDGLKKGATHRIFRPGFEVLEHRRTLEDLLIVVGSGYASPARLLAAVVPAMAAGVGKVTVTLSDEPDKAGSALLTALELAGCDMVMQVDVSWTQAMIRDLFKNSRSLGVMCLGPVGEGVLTAAKDCGAALSLVLDDRAMRAGLWWDQEDHVQLETIAWSHPDLRPGVWNHPEAGLPAGWTMEHGEWEAFLDHGYDIGFVPRHLVIQASSHIPFVIGPGCESCWIWPGVTLDSFRRIHTAVLTTSGA